MHQTYVEQLDTDQRYDVIVSGLPLTNFTPVQVERIMARYMELLHPGGTLTYFAYLGTRKARALTASRAEARRHAAVDEIMAAYQRTYATGRWTVSANVPPRLRLAPATTSRLRGPPRAAVRRGAAVNALSDILGHISRPRRTRWWPPLSWPSRSFSSALSSRR